MKKIAIITLNGYTNYGNRLQNYATQEVFSSLGFFVETILVDHTPKNSKINKTKGIKKIIAMASKVRRSGLNLKAFKKILLLTSTYLNKVKNKSNQEKRIKTFKDFSLYYIKETNYILSESNIPENLDDKYDYFIAGSDQIWNPFYTNGSPIYFLTFASQNKRVAYSASFGLSGIPPIYIENYRLWLSEMHRISVREEDGASIVKELTGKDVIVTLDPTIMITKNKWLAIGKKSKHKPSCNYLLTYFIGDINQNAKLKIKDIAKNNNLKIINLNNPRNSKTYIIGPSEFIDYINSASLVCTDSYHGTIFSILLERPFIVFERTVKNFSMYSRIETLLDKFDLNNRKDVNIKNNNRVFDVDFESVRPIIDIEREKALNYLREALSINE
ncbi:MAG: polysaccharide pyruvyl transferase family protein [Candidatus Methanofastidiosum sp.]|nr:polysaccharide pyruvyl transferase family protein [Methanofastidiosum sp.]